MRADPPCTWSSGGVDSVRKCVPCAVWPRHEARFVTVPEAARVCVSAACVLFAESRTRRWLEPAPLPARALGLGKGGLTAWGTRAQARGRQYSFTGLL